MRVLIAQRSLSGIRGAQLVAAEVSKELAERGHEVTVYSPKTGDLAKLMWSSDVSVITQLRDYPHTPDIIHGQHHLPTMAALARFPQTPAIYYCHAVQNWVAAPPLHPNIRQYVMMCEWMVGNAHAQFGLPGSLITALPNFVNINRFSVVRSPPERLTRALLFAGPRMPSKDLQALRNACRDNGLTLDCVGNGGEDRRERPEMFLPEYELVFAIGRSALEALAAGCAVIPIIPGQAGTLVTQENFDTWSFSNFSPRHYTSAATTSSSWLQEQLANYSPQDAAAVTARVRHERTLDGAVTRLESIYAEAAASAVPEPKATAFAPYLEKMADEADEVWSASLGAWRIKGLEDNIRRLERELLDLHRRQARPTLGRMLRGIKRLLTGAKKGK